MNNELTTTNAPALRGLAPHALRADRPRQPACTFISIVQSQGDGTYVVKPGRPVERLTVKQAARRAGCSIFTIYRLYEMDILQGERPSPRKILIYADSLERHLAATRDPEYWQSTRAAEQSAHEE
ncbi:MAG: hypothetical protein AB1705_22075 [Verrucomicrobiota bacterium]